LVYDTNDIKMSCIQHAISHNLLDCRHSNQRDQHLPAINVSDSLKLDSVDKKKIRHVMTTIRPKGGSNRNDGVGQI
jgi:hypothetical protein